MKECPKCHTQYDDNVVYCTNDGSLLQDVSQNSYSGTGQVSGAGSKKRGVLKTVLIVLAVVLVVLGFLYNKVKNSATYLRTEPSLVTGPKVGGECTIEIDYDGYMWSINHKPNWVNIKEDENSFVVEVTPNTSGQSREGSITVQSGKQLAQVVVKQSGRATKIKTTQAYLKFDKRGGAESIGVETDGCGYEIECPDWLSVKNNSGGIRVTCPKNEDEYRTGFIYLKEDGVNSRISVVQSGKCNVCHGSGQANCGVCNGTGVFFFGGYSMRCSNCGGYGSFRCGSCGGSGERE